MKFFTLDWWLGDSGGDMAVFTDYDTHFLSIQEKLPATLIELHERHTLHDSRVSQVLVSPSDSTAHLKLEGFDLNLQFPVSYSLTFIGVSRFEQTLPHERSLEQELGDLGYWELDICAQGIEMRMLFVSGAEFVVVFSGFEFTAKSVTA